MLNVLSGMMALHDNGYIHRDIDPSNIMITSDGKIKIIDFGISKKINNPFQNSPHLTSAGQFMGKAAYAAPELVTGDIAHQNQTTDIYAVGIMLYQLATNLLPFEGSTHEVMEMQLHQLIPYEKVVDEHLRRIVQKATAKRQTDRYISAAEFRVDIERFGQYLQSENPVFTLEQPSEVTNMVSPPRVKRKWPIYAMGSFVVLFVIVIAGLLVSHIEAKRGEKQARIEARIASLKEEMFDSSNPNAVLTDSISGYPIRSVGSWLAEAQTLLSTSEPESLRKGVKILSNIVSKRYASSSQAAYLMGRLYYQHTVPDSMLQDIRNKLVGILPPDGEQAHAMNHLSVELDSTCYQGLYELACDYLNSKYRVGDETLQDLVKARYYFEKGFELARNASDSAYVIRFKRRLEDLGQL